MNENRQKHFFTIRKLLATCVCDFRHWPLWPLVDCWSVLRGDLQPGEEVVWLNSRSVTTGVADLLKFETLDGEQKALKPYCQKFAGIENPKKSIFTCRMIA